MGKKFFILIDFWPITALIAICMLIFSAIHKKPLLIFIRAKDKKFARYKTRKRLPPHLKRNDLITRGVFIGVAIFIFFIIVFPWIGDSIFVITRGISSLPIKEGKVECVSTTSLTRGPAYGQSLWFEGDNSMYHYYSLEPKIKEGKTYKIVYLPYSKKVLTIKETK